MKTKKKKEGKKREKKPKKNIASAESDFKSNACGGAETNY